MNQKIGDPQGGVGVGAGQRPVSRRAAVMRSTATIRRTASPPNLECVPTGVCWPRRNAYHAPTPAPGDKDAYKATIRIAQIKEAIATR